MKIDAFCHITPARYYERIDSLGDTPEAANIRKRVAGIPVLRDLDERFRVLEEFGDDYVQILSLAAPAIEQFGDASLGRELARVGNEEMAELCQAYPDRFVGFAASLPMNDIDVALEELDHALGELGALGVQIYGHVNGRPLDDPRFEPFFERMAALDRPIWVHPARNVDWPDYPTESKSKYEIWWMLGWPYETGVFMARVVFSGILERHPNLKILTHHAGGVVPHLVGRIGPGMRSMGARTPEHERELVEHSLSRPPVEYFKMFYADTALFGAPEALESAIAFFGVDRVLFASDMPFDPEKGPSFIRASIADVEAVDLSDDERQAIYEGNARRVLGVGAATAA